MWSMLLHRVSRHCSSDGRKRRFNLRKRDTAFRMFIGQSVQIVVIFVTVFMCILYENAENGLPLVKQDPGRSWRQN